MAVCLALAAACGGDDEIGPTGATGDAGPAGPVGPSGEAGAPGLGLSDGDGGLLVLTLSDRAERGLQIAPVPLNLAGKTAAQIEEIGVGSYLANALAECTTCHTPPAAPGQPVKYLAGGVVFPLGPGQQVVSRNLTPDPATGLKDTLDQFIQASRKGTDILNTGAALMLHPWQHHRWLSTSDLTAVYRYLQVIPAVNNAYEASVKPPALGAEYTGKYNEGEVDRPLPPEEVTEIPGAPPVPVPDPNNVLRGLAIVPLAITFPTDPDELALFGRGSYIINAGGGCSACHTNPDRNYGSPKQEVNTAAYFSGGRVIAAGPQLAPFVGVQRSMAANLIGNQHGFFNASGMSFAVFLRTITQGVHALQDDGNGNAPPLAFPMPYKEFRNLTLDDLKAVYTYFRYIADRRPITGTNDKITQPAARYCGPRQGAPDATCLANETCQNNECIGAPCSSGDTCGACQTCTSGHCAAPADNSTCLTGGL